MKFGRVVGGFAVIGAIVYLASGDGLRKGSRPRPNNGSSPPYPKRTITTTKALMTWRRARHDRRARN
jgi:hypothetical protein